MTRGKHSTQVAERERAEARRLTSERDAALRQLAAVERQRDELAAWRADAEANGLPALRAERERAEAQARRVNDAVAEEAARWRRYLDDFEPTLRNLFRSGRNKATIDDAGLAALADMYGETATEIMTGKFPSRNQRRNTRDGAAVRAQRRLLGEASRQGYRVS